ncbi:DUF6282 family protein [Sinanaerobacter chloroacetimidivorans]|uniref:Cytosolic protein n=1 Tax=Sinanaerobacter chloroacetimidivorans TaxID=2818044 RepID=A0A8J7VWX6_9FIRM|nr:DUF6282 family protein [Sinanaerobacter chloroacetimidivorans]MBR0596549.1 hypothetical protein [Sinanaerobacter chloroacetimidivorans]
MSIIDQLMVGAVDMHQHLGPSVIPRALDVVEGALEAEAAGMKAILIKDHQFPSMASVEIAKKSLTKDTSLLIASSLVLNHEVGGLNVAAVETAINMGVKMIWMPTISTENHHVEHEKGGLKFPASKKKIETLPRSYIPILNEEGELTSDCVSVLEIMAKDQSVVLGTGHGNVQEIDAIIQKALSLGVHRIVVNHPTYMINADIEKMQEWGSKGVYMEFGACTCDPISSICNAKVSDTVKTIRAIGTEHVTLASDYGQVGNPHPVEGLKHFGELLLDQGFSVEELEQMMKMNPSKVMGI